MHEELLHSISSQAPNWRKTPLQRKVEILNEMIDLVEDLGVNQYIEWSSLSLQTQLMDPKVQAVETAFEAIVLVSVIKGQLSRLKENYSSLIKNGRATPPVSTRIRKTSTTEAGGVEGEQVIATVFPLNMSDKFGPQGSWKGELWIKPNREATQGSCLKINTDEGSFNTVTVVLGAGNQGFLTVIDCLDALFVHNETVLLKHHPLRGYQDSFIRKIFAPLIQLNYFNAVADTTVQDAAALVSHPLVSRVHMTGGKKTHDCIVWGNDDEERKERKLRKEPKLKAKMTSELGCVTPWIVIPGKYTEKELVHQASHLAGVLNANGSCNCNSPKVILLSDQWDQKQRFIEEVKSALKEVPMTPPYYPGEKNRYESFKKAYSPNDSEIIQPNNDVIPRTRYKNAINKTEDLPFLTVNVSISADGSSCTNNYALRNEAFSPVVAFATVNNLSNDKPTTFMNAASNICNNKIFGTLSCTVIVHPSTEKIYPDEFETFIANLKYGTVCINAWTALCYAIDTVAWGAFPGEDLRNVESGNGYVSKMCC